MNPGYASLLLSFITLILLSTGWKKVLLGGIPQRAVVAFFMLWLPSSFVQVRIGPEDVDLSIAVFAAVSVAGVVAVKRTADRLHVLACGLLLASVYFLSGELMRASPALSFRKPEEAGVLILVVIGVLLTRSCLSQLIILNTALLAGHLMMAFIHHPSGVIGGPEFQDQWWQTLLAVRIVTVTMENGWTACCRFVIAARERRKDGWK